MSLKKKNKLIQIDPNKIIKLNEPVTYKGKKGKIHYLRYEGSERRFTVLLEDGLKVYLTDKEFTFDRQELVGVDAVEAILLMNPDDIGPKGRRAHE